MISPDFFFYPHNSKTAEQEAAKKLIALISKSLNKNLPVLLLLSGGTWITAINKDKFNNIKIPNIDKLTIIPLDERAEIGPNNNFLKLINSTLISTFINSGVKTISTLPQEKESIHLLGERINQQLKDYFQKNPNAILIATASVGGVNNVPGHIAGIEPREKNDFKFLFQDPDVFYQGYIAKSLKPKLRATATFTLLDRVNHFVLLILNSKEKKQSLDLILSSSQTSLHQTPCVYFRNHFGTTIYTDIPKQ